MEARAHFDGGSIKALLRCGRDVDDVDVAVLLYPNGIPSGVVGSGWSRASGTGTKQNKRPLCVDRWQLALLYTTTYTHNSLGDGKLIN